ncbi:hypothetical protein O181_121612 [Austropuccinia psidii MF-1]|uniref:Uncharacterized protein n=1 Tax=Austropuccinia psidii MF-1 TaxID=1389203 RepID=A0A9Q3KLH4_9BASI|nr:hypothetical protein [Austropuccinia psidii MF-1]
MFLYAIIPGPKEPSLDQMNSILEPLVIELQMLWNGIWLSNTHNFPQGRLIRVALLPLIADLPALCKVAGFASHSANQFCYFCNITRVEINEIHISKFETRTHENHISKENEWLQLQTKKEQDECVKTHGVQWSILKKLDYWRKIDFCGIDIMHFLILGDIKDYCILFLKMGKRKNEDDNDSEKIIRPKKQNLTKANFACIQPPTSQRHKGSSEASRTKSDQTAKRNRTSNSRYSIRYQTTTSTVLNLLPFTHGSDSLAASDSSFDDTQYLNPMGDETPRLKKR